MIKSIIFTFTYIIWTGLFSIVGMLLFPFPSIYAIKWAHLWAYGIKYMLKYIVGITYEVKGFENVPEGSVIIASKHQSAFETIVYHLIFNKAVFVVKKELLYLPFFGWQLLKAGSIALDRKSGAKAMKKLLSGVMNRAKLGRQIIIFPEGTRTRYGEEVKAYNPGVALLYEKTNLPVIPVAINSGKVWGRNSMWKKSGKITVEIMPPMPFGMGKKEFLQELNNKIETACKNMG
ncbi:MAG: 1-acyl-sn-glycerol-3-phosphate acyltransferase [Alphaproteobacteria bacterium ADurb.Bin438]|nr:MAG: 1-acyl-sn-glycerol-3-phosphate acyltransferase [Alphaproteobacteria bacterium ADurb.Bin438]